jgi:hypothetical protein
MTVKLSQEPTPGGSWNAPADLWRRKTTVIAALSIAAIVLHLVFRFGFYTTPSTYQCPLLAMLALGGLSLLYRSSFTWRMNDCRSSL